MNASTPLLSLRDVRVQFPVSGIDLPLLGLRARHVSAVNGVTLSLAPGETLGIVGESGCGKTTLGRAVLGLVETTGGEVLFGGRPVTTRDKASLAGMRSQAAMIFQDPYGSLNPLLSIGEAIGEVMRVHRKVETAAISDRVRELLRLVGLGPELIDRRPHQLSGGQCQRAGIARALALEPKLIIADECVAALDVSIQAQVLNLLLELQHEMQLSLIFISHDLGAVRHLCRRIAIMYLGRVVEHGPTDSIFATPKHPYTRALLSAVPSIDPNRPLAPEGLRGEPPSPLVMPQGCSFHPRCPHSQAICIEGGPPVLRDQGSRSVACHFDLP